MMLGVSGGAAAAEAVEAHESGGASGGSGSSSVPGGAIEDSERSGGGGGGGGNRWPRQETLALLKIRSDMDVAFRDASLKGPLWDEVSRKMAELGFQRHPKKCKEKFENVYKYHKRTKDGRSTKPDGKSYRFFDQLEALENTPPNSISFTPPPPPPRPQPLAATAMAAPANGAPNIPPMPSISPTPLSIVHPNNTQKTPINTPPSFQPLQHPQSNFQPSLHPYNNVPTGQLSNSTSSSSSTSSDEDIIQRRRGKKRKWKDYFERLMKDVVHKQEELQKKFLEALEKREKDRMARDEAWRVQETARINREHDLLLHERSISAAKDAAVIAFLQKATHADDRAPPENNPPPPQQPPPPRRQQPPAMPPPPPAAAAAPAQQAGPLAVVATEQVGPLAVAVIPSGGGSASRWPKAEVEALINLRTRLDLKYMENGPKGPLWEEISAEMGKIGYKRSSKRCKEKWENINKYFKKVKESNKRRPEDSKTCPYFHQLEAIYKERANHSSNNHGPSTFEPESPMLPIMARPEQQWPLSDQQQLEKHDSVLIMHGHDQDGSENNEHEEEEDEEEEEEEEDEGGGGGGGFEIMVNKQEPSSVANTAE
ncbi:hypothetical protein ABFX02_03G089000 [Erythranthe guttata]